MDKRTGRQAIPVLPRFVPNGLAVGRGRGYNRPVAKAGIRERRWNVLIADRPCGLSWVAPSFVRAAVLALAPLMLVSGAAPTADAAQSPAPAKAASAPVANHEALLKTYCATCHNQRLKTAGLVLEGLPLTDLPVRAEIWEKVIRRLRTNTMPPESARQPDRAAASALATYLEDEIDRAAAASPNPGRTEAFHRLNRAEYANVVRDLFALDVIDTSELPADDASYGFDNMAGTLKMSSSLLEQYLASARRAVRAAIGGDRIPASARTVRVKSDFSQRDQVDGLALGSRGGVAVSHVFPVAAEYEIQVAMRNSNRSDTLELSLDDEVVKSFNLADAPGNEDGLAVKLRLPVAGGEHRIVATFAAQSYPLVDGYRQPFELSDGGRPAVASVTIAGPYNSVGRSGSAARRRIFTCHPASEAEEPACARQILSTLARRGYRRPVNADDLQPLLDAFAEGRANGGFESGIELALRRLLISPELLYRIERDPAKVPASRTYAVSDLELASRLSFFLWSSLPDDQLLDLAARGKLREPAVIKAQVARMLADRRFDALVENFTGQWLYLRNLPSTLPDVVLFPDFSENLRQDFRKETELFFASLVRGNGSVLDLLTADYTFLNERLARWYGVDGVYGTRFRRVRLADDHRRGILGQGSFLTVTSHANRTSVVGRGKWVLENLLGSPPPPPPPNVPALTENPVSGRQRTLRERMAAHRANPVCASCHAKMDPIGFALENFNAVGQWRTQESYLPIDPASTLSDGTRIDGPAGLRRMLLQRPEQIATTVTEKLLTYALGRGLEPTDAPAVRQIVRGAAPTGYRLSTLILGIVQSTPFQMRRTAAAGAALSARLPAAQEPDRR